MGRKKRYDREEVLERAMHVFWMRGFEATSTRDLEEEMGVNRFSLYAEFGSKQGLYEAAMDRYLAQEVGLRTAILEADGAGLAEISALFQRFASRAGSPETVRGCFLCNAASERSGTDDATRSRVERYVERFEAAFKHALAGAVTAGELRADLDLDAQASALTTTVLGMFLLIRAQVSPVRIRAAAEVAMTQLTANAPS